VLLNDVSMTSLSNTQSTVDMAMIRSGVEDLELVCVRKEDTSNIAFELTDCVDFVNHLSLYNCVVLCLNIRSLSKTTLL